jgi:multidrug transporter EmrE-like cation transporter
MKHTSLFRSFIPPVIVFLLGFVLYLLLRDQNIRINLSHLVTTFSPWPSVPFVIIMILGIVLFSRRDTFRRLIGEPAIRNGASHRGVLYFIFVPLFMLFSLYYLWGRMDSMDTKVR